MGEKGNPRQGAQTKWRKGWESLDGFETGMPEGRSGGGGQRKSSNGSTERLDKKDLEGGGQVIDHDPTSERQPEAKTQAEQPQADPKPNEDPATKTAKTKATAKNPQETKAPFQKASPRRAKQKLVIKTAEQLTLERRNRERRVLGLAPLESL